LFWLALLAAFAMVSRAWAGALYAASLVVGWNGLFSIIAALILAPSVYRSVAGD